MAIIPSESTAAPSAGAMPPPPPVSSSCVPGSGVMPSLLAVVLSLCLGLFLVDAVVSLANELLMLFVRSGLLAGFSGLIGFLTLTMSAGLYLLIGLTPSVPKRIFLPVALFNLVGVLAICPLVIYFSAHFRLITCAVAAVQVLLGVGLLCWAQGGFKLRWPLLPVGRLHPRRFSWLNLGGFVLANALLAPAVFVYLFYCSSLAVRHFSGGFMALRSDGFSVQVRKYVRDDGKTVELFPMTHVADGGFYQQVSRTFPTNSVILMEGVSDRQNLLTNKISYARMAKTFHVAEQHEAFAPTRGELVPADVDVAAFSPQTIQLLNLVMLIHSQGATPENVRQLLDYSPAPGMEQKLFDDLLRNRNRHLLAEIQAHLAQTDKVMVPWGVAHMPGIAREIQKSGFRLVDSQDFMVIRFHAARKSPPPAGP